MTATLVAAPARATRSLALDGLRGAGVLLMVLDHVLVLYAPGHVVRFTLTRLALPFFLLVAGALWRPGLRERHLHLVGAALIATALQPWTHLPTPDVLVVILLALVVLEIAHRVEVEPWIVGVAGVVVWQTFGGWWDGYPLGEVLVLLVVGHLVGRERIARASTWALPFAPAGRYPLTVYVGHLGVLAIACLFH